MGCLQTGEASHSLNEAAAVAQIATEGITSHSLFFQAMRSADDVGSTRGFGSNFLFPGQWCAVLTFIIS